MSTLTQTFSEFALSTPTADMPADVLDRAIAAMVDTVGCALAGIQEPVVEIAAASISDTNTPMSAGVWGSKRRVAIADAAFVNAIATHALDFDDNLPTQRGHPSTTVLPVVLAIADAVGTTGPDVLAAYALGIETSGKLGPTVGYGHYVRGWHPTATIGIFGAAAAAARLLALTPVQLAHAWGICASQTSGLVANFGTMTKPFNAGHAARCAVNAVLLARSGFTANPAIFDGPHSVLATYQAEGATPLHTQLSKLGDPWEIASPGIFMKRWPCCYCSHRPLSALLSLLSQHRIDVNEIDSIAIGFPPGTDGGLRSEIPTTGLGGKFSVEYTIAAAVLDGEVSLASFTDAMVQRPQAQAFLSRVHRHDIEDTRRWSSAIGYNVVTIVTPRGTFTEKIDITPGSPQAPLSRDELDAKFRDCALSALGTEKTEQALKAMHALYDAESCRSILDAIRA